MQVDKIHVCCQVLTINERIFEGHVVKNTILRSDYTYSDGEDI